MTYTLSCCCILFPYLPILLVGRLFGGVSTSILFSAFESWVVSASNSLALPQSDLSLILGRATLVNGFVAAGAGIFSNQLVGSTGSFASPYVASGALLVLAYVVIRATWSENYGGVEGASEKAEGSYLRKLAQAWRIVQRGTLTCLWRACFIHVAHESNQIQRFSPLASRRHALKEACTYLFSYGFRPSKKQPDRPPRFLWVISSPLSWSA